MDSISLIILAVTIGLLIIWAVQQRNDRTPPGPTGWPIVGNLLSLFKKPLLYFEKLEKIYGPVFSLKLGGMNVIILNDFESTKDAFFQDAFMGRPTIDVCKPNKETEETEALSGLPWKYQRRFSLRVLRDLGFGKSKLDDMLKEEIDEMLVHFEESGGKPMNIRLLLTSSMSNNIASLIYGRRMKYDDPDRIMLDRIWSEFSAATSSVAWQIFFPWVAKLIQILRFGAEWKIQRLLREIKAFAKKEIENHEKTLDENNIRDYVDGYLVEVHKNKDPAFCKPVLEDLSVFFFAGGSDTVRVTIEWLLLALTTHPEIQAKVQAEIENVIGSRSPSWNDHLEMPYTEATILEVLRWRPPIPLNLVRYTLWDTELNGYKIPKHSAIMANLWSVLHNPKYWGPDVEEFRPERFLTDDGKTLNKPDYHIPFSIGKRSCPGEPFARSEIFLYLVCILQKYHVSLPEGSTPDLEGGLGISMSPNPFEICLKKRH